MRKLAEGEDALAYYKLEDNKYKVPAMPRDIHFRLVDNKPTLTYNYPEALWHAREKTDKLIMAVDLEVRELPNLRMLVNQEVKNPGPGDIQIINNLDKNLGKLDYDDVFTFVNKTMHFFYDEDLVHILPGDSELYDWAEEVVNDLLKND